MKSRSIKTVDGIRYDLPPTNDELEVVMRPGIPELFFIKLQSPGVIRYVNINHIVCITEKSEEGQVP